MSRARRVAMVATVLVATALAAPSIAPAAEPSRQPSPEQGAFAEKPGYLQLQAKAMFGTGLRFNNPYRLPTVLGDTAESVSRTPIYTDVGLAVLFGSPTHLQHGADLSVSMPLEGIRQTVLVPSYVLSRRRGALAAALRVATPIVLTPNTTVGGELAVSGTYYFRAAVGARVEVVGDVFYGAGTIERATPAYPMLSLALGIVVAYEVLP